MLSSAAKGAIAEAEITAAAVELGLQVLRPIQEGCRYDLVLDLGHRFLRVQCKWAKRDGDVIVVRARTARHSPTRGHVFSTYCADEIDGIAAFCQDTDACYWIPIEEISGKANLHLRLAPARNHQTIGLHFATDYPLGAIAQLGERSAGSRKVEGSSPSSSIDNLRPLF
jgi:hypothetical protein